MYSENDKALLWLNLFEHLTYNRKRNILGLFSSASEMYENFTSKPREIAKIAGEDVYGDMKQLKSKMILDNHIDTLDKENIKAITLFSSEYPVMLKNTSEPPFVLYCMGNTDLLKTDCIGVIGTRNCTRYGVEVTEKFTEVLAKNGMTIVSGMALGIDTVAHETTLKNNGKTIAVLAGGFHSIYPQSNFNLSQRIAEFGLLVSEYKPSEKSNRYNFPVRNRIIAGLSKGVLITEAGEKSGSMYTKEYALEYGRDLFVVPGNITNVRSSGCNKIIKDLQGTMVLKPKDILSTYGIESSEIFGKSAVQTTLNEQIIISLFKGDELHYDEILVKTAFDAKRLNSLLTTMQIRGIIKKLAGNYYSL